VRLRNNFSPFYDSNEPTKNKKIYISRVYSSRSPSFELNLQEYLKSCGWNIMIAEQLSLAEQIRAVSSAEVLMGVHGAGLSHALWMKPNTKLVEIRFPASPNCFVRLAKAADISYEPLLLSPQDMHSSAIPNILAESDLVKLGGLNQ
jgi:capsular polysaccharide biosynthesis protein